MKSLSKIQKLVILIILDIALIYYTIGVVYEDQLSGEMARNWRGDSGLVLGCILISLYLLKLVRQIICERKSDGKKSTSGS